MGVVAKQFTKRLIADQQVSWARVLPHPALTVSDDLELALVRAMASVGIVASSTNWQQTSGRNNALADAVQSDQSILRVEGGRRGSCRIDLGCVSPIGSYVEDWTIIVTVDQGEQSVTISTPQYRTRDGELNNKSLYKRTIAAIADELARPVGVEARAGVPDFTECLRTEVLESLSAFSDDYLLDLPPAAVLGPLFGLYQHEVPSIVEAARATGIPLGTGAAVSLDLATGLAGVDAWLDLHTGQGQAWFALRCPIMGELGRIQQNRVWRSLLRTLMMVRSGLPEGSTSIAAIDGFVAPAAEVYGRFDTTDAWHTIWSPTQPAKVIRLDKVDAIPVGLIATAATLPLSR